MRLPDLRHHLGAVVATLFGALLLLLAAAMPWWQLAGDVAPKYVMIVRLVAAVTAVGAIFAIFVKSRNSAIVMGAGLVGLGLVFGLIFSIATTDSASVIAAFLQTNQAASTWGSISGGENAVPMVGWDSSYTLNTSRNIFQSYYLLDALENVSYFVKSGWLLGLVGSALLVLAALSWDRTDVAWFFRRFGVGIIGLIAVFLVCTLGRDYMGFVASNEARYDFATTHYTDALHEYQRAIKWDKRLDYDLRIHSQIGRIYLILGQNQEPDAWAYQSDQYYTGGRPAVAAALYAQHIDQINANPTIRLRYVQILLNRAAYLFNNNAPQTAIQNLDTALKLDPENLTAQYFLAACYTQLREYHAAIPMWRTVITNNESIGLFRFKFFTAEVYRKPITSKAFRHMAWCYYNLGQNDLAMKCYQFSREQGTVSLKELDK